MNTVTRYPLRELINFNQAAAILPRRPHRSTWERWCTQGLQGIILWSYFVSGERRTHPDALLAFLDAVNAARSRHEFHRSTTNVCDHTPNCTAKAAGQMLDELWQAHTGSQ